MSNEVGTLKILRTVAELRAWRRSFSPGLSVGFVPTMGALHAGHASLLERAAAENDFVILSIFVNPTQFNQPSDLEKYPRTEAADLEMARAIGIDAVFIPSDPKEIYTDGYRYQVVETEFSKTLDGIHRPGHFEGMMTVVLKLLGLMKSTRAYFGEKDFQQLSLIQGMARAFFLDTEIVGCPTIRESDGLAMSSRNTRLSEAERGLAPMLHSIMASASDLEVARKTLESAGFRVDYLEDRKTPNGEIRRFAAAFLGDVRLIDNISLAPALGREGERT